MSKEKQIEEMDERAYDCDECEHFRVCYKIHQYHVQQINTGLYCPSFKRKQEEGEWILQQNGKGVCSKCNRQDNMDELACFCRYCGARMKGV